MSRKQFFLVTVVLALFGLSCRPAPLQAAPSLDAADRFQFPIVVGSRSETVDLFRDHVVPSKFYYTLLHPRLEETMRMVTGRATTLPVFHLTIYQVQKNSQQVFEGGQLQFAATLALPEGTAKGKGTALEQLRDGLSQQIKNLKSADIQLTPLPVVDGHVFLHLPSGGGALIEGERRKVGVTPASFDQAVPFTVNLSAAGANVFSALLTGNTGLNVVYHLEFEGVATLAGFEMRVDWERLRQHFSLKENRGYQKTWDRVATASAKDVAAICRDIVDFLRSRQLVSTKVRGADLLPKTEDLRAAQPILHLMYQEVFGHPLARPLPLGGKAVPLSTARAAMLQKNAAVFDFSVRQTVRQKLVAEGFVGVGGFLPNKAVLEKVLNRKIEVDDFSDPVGRQLVSFFNFSGGDHAYFHLPLIMTDPKLQVTRVEILLKLKDEQDVRDEREVFWKPVGNQGLGAWMQGGKEVTQVAFGLASYSKEVKRRLKFEIATTIRHGPGGRKEIKDTTQRPLFLGSSAVDLLLDHVRPITISGLGLPFKEGVAQLKAAKVRALHQGQLLGEKWLTAEDRQAVFLLKTTGEPKVKLEVTYVCDHPEVREFVLTQEETGLDFHLSVKERISATGELVKQK